MALHKMGRDGCLLASALVLTLLASVACQSDGNHGGSTNTAGNSGGNGGATGSDGGSDSSGTASNTTPYESPELPALTKLPPDLGPRIPMGIEAGDPSEWEATAPARCWWVDAAAASGGDGSFEAPYNSFEAVVGALHGTDYVQGQIGSGDFLYVRGVFNPPEVDDPDHLLKIIFRRENQGGTAENPTVIKSWRGSARAIFDGDQVTSDLLQFANISSFRVANIEIRNAGGRGISVESFTGQGIFEDLVIHHTIGNGTIGTGGGLHFYGGGKQEAIVRHCHFYKNNINEVSTNNVGALSITSDLLPPDIGILSVTANIFEDETTGVRHKHAGNIDTTIEGNLFWKGRRGVWLRSFKNNEIRQNVFLDLSETAILSYVENTNGELQASIHHNNFFNTTRMLTDIIGLYDHVHHLSFLQNFYHSTNSSIVYEVSNKDTLPYLGSFQNIYVIPDELTFSKPTDGEVVNFKAFHAALKDTTSTASPTTSADSTIAAHNAAYERFAIERAAGSIGY